MTDVLGLTALGAPFSGVMLYLLRRRLLGGIGRFLTGLAIGVAALALATVFLMIYVSQPTALIVEACLAEPLGQRTGCEDAGLVIAVIFLAGASACLLFLLGGVGLRFLRAPRRGPRHEPWREP